jgi:transmembrane sensor
MREATEWLAALELGTADSNRFEEWREADPRHALAFARVYSSAQTLSRLARPDDAKAEEETARSRRRFLRVAASGVAVTLGGSVFFASRALAWSHADTAVGEFRKVGLPDGSIVEMNTDTQISWHFGDEVRKLRLHRGEIALELQPGAPARLSSAGAEASLSAGRFIARLNHQKVDLLVLRGKALVDPLAGTGAKPILPRETAALSREGTLVATTSDDAISRATAWQSGEVEFEDERLADAVAEYNRYLPRTIVIDDPRLAEQRIGGRFATSDPKGFLAALTLSLDVRVTETARAVHLSL